MAFNIAGLREINGKYLGYLNQSNLMIPPLQSTLPYYVRPSHNIFSMPSVQTPYPVRDGMLPLVSGNYRGDMLPVPCLPGTNIPINDVAPVSSYYDNDGFKATFRTLGYSPAELCVIARYNHVEVVATKKEPLSGKIVKETRLIIGVPFPLLEDGLQTGVELDGAIGVFAPWRPPQSMLPYYVRPSHNIFSMPSLQTPYPVRDAILPLVSGSYRGDMLPLVSGSYRGDMLPLVSGSYRGDMLPLVSGSYRGDMLPLVSGSYRGDMLPVPCLPGTNFTINDVAPISSYYDNDGFKASFRTLGYSPDDLCVIARYDHMEVVATKKEPLSGKIVKETRLTIGVPFPLLEYRLQTGVQLDGTIGVFVPWRSV